NYCYLRNETTIKHEAKYEERLTDNGTQKLMFNDVIMIYLVAFVRNADVYDVLENLKNTLMQYKELNLLPVVSSWNRELVVKEELSGAKKEEIATTLKRLKDETVLKITVQVS